MVNFSNIERLNPTGTELVPMELDIEGLSEIIVLYMRPATMSNKELMAAQTKLASKKARQTRRRSEDELLEESMEEIRQQFAEYVICDWEDVFDADGNAVEFSAENCLDFLRVLPLDVFMDILNFARDRNNFVNLADGDNGEALGKP